MRSGRLHTHGADEQQQGDEAGAALGTRRPRILGAQYTTPPKAAMAAASTTYEATDVVTGVPKSEVALAVDERLDRLDGLQGTGERARRAASAPTATAKRSGLASRGRALAER